MSFYFSHFLLLIPLLWAGICYKIPLKVKYRWILFLTMFGVFLLIRPQFNTKNIASQTLTEYDTQTEQSLEIRKHTVESYEPDNHKLEIEEILNERK